MSVEVIAPDQINVIVESPEIVSAEVDQPAGISVITLYEQGPPGPPGPSGASTLGGHPVHVCELKPGDLLTFSGDVWVNRNKVEISDGGNF